MTGHSNPLRTFLDHLDAKGVRHSGGSDGTLRFACTGHGGTGDNAVASLGDDGKLLLFCHSKGCSAEDICRGAGMEPHEMFPTKTPSHRKSVRKVSIDGKKVSVHASQSDAALAAAYGIEQVATKAGWPFKERKPDFEYTYYDLNGCVSFVVCRWNTPGRPDGKTKEIRQIRPHEGGWITKGLKNNRPLYNLPIILSPDVNTVFLVEGEKCVNVLVAYDVASTTSAGGAEAASKTDWSVLNWKTVIIWPDNDEAGDNYTRNVIAIIRQQAPNATIEIRWLKDDWPEIPTKGDVYDWLQHFKNEPPEALKARLDALPNRIDQYEIPDADSKDNASNDIHSEQTCCNREESMSASEVAIDSADAPMEQRFLEGQRVRCGDRRNIGTVVQDDGGRTVSVHFRSKDGTQATKDIHREQVSSTDGSTNEKTMPRRSPISLWKSIEEPPPMREVVIEGLLRRGEVCNIIASTKVGKSWLAMSLAISVATGRNWLGRTVKKGNVVIVDNELHEETLANRISIVANALEIKHDDKCGTLDGFTLRGSGDSGLKLLSRDLDIYKPGEVTLLILDAKYRFFGEDQDENSNADQTKFHNDVDRIAAQLGCGIVLVHHATKGNQSGKSVTDAGSGGGSQSRAVDTHLVIRPHADDGYAVLDAAVRTFPPVESQTIQWEYPLWRAASAVEAVLKPEANRGDSGQAVKDLKGLSELTEIMHRAKGEPLNRNQLHTQFGGGIERVNRLIRLGIKDGRIVHVGTKKVRNGESDLYCLKSYLPRDGI